MTDVQTTTDAELRDDEPCRPCAAATRRHVLLGAGAVGATAVLAACGTSSTGGNTNGEDYSNNPAPAGSKGAAAGGTGNGGGSGDGGGAGTALAKAADVKVGSGVIAGDYVITQPAQGTFKAFSKVCTHAGCDVNKVDGGVISCPCHGSKFSIEDGSPTAGPATKPLAETKVKEEGGNIVAA
jgi:Rieske Fe-S protein